MDNDDDFVLGCLETAERTTSNPVRVISQPISPRSPRKATSVFAETTHIKVVLVGDSGVGKTCILNRFYSDRFEANTPATIGCDFQYKVLNYEGKRIALNVWDTAGQERYLSMASSYYRGAHGVIFVYDVTRRSTFENLKTYWLPEAVNNCLPNVVQLIVANKIDLVANREVSTGEGIAFAKFHNCLYQETSAKEDIGIDAAFIWGVVCTILGTPGLLPSPHAVEDEAAEGAGSKQNSMSSTVRGSTMNKAAPDGKPRAMLASRCAC